MFDVHGRCDNTGFHSAQITLQEHNLLAQTATKMQYIMSLTLRDADFLRYLKSNGTSEASIGDWKDLNALAENHAWEKTMSGSRLPHSFATSEIARERGYVFLEKRGIDLPADPFGIETNYIYKLKRALAGERSYANDPPFEVEITDKKSGTSKFV